MSIRAWLEKRRREKDLRQKLIGVARGKVSRARELWKAGDISLEEFRKVKREAKRLKTFAKRITPRFGRRKYKVEISKEELARYFKEYLPSFEKIRGFKGAEKSILHYLPEHITLYYGPVARIAGFEDMLLDEKLGKIHWGRGLAKRVGETLADLKKKRGGAQLSDEVRRVLEGQEYPPEETPVGREEELREGIGIEEIKEAEEEEKKSGMGEAPGASPVKGVSQGRGGVGVPTGERELGVAPKRLLELYKKLERYVSHTETPTRGGKRINEALLPEAKRLLVIGPKQWKEEEINFVQNLLAEAEKEERKIEGLKWAAAPGRRVVSPEKTLEYIDITKPEEVMDKVREMVRATLMGKLKKENLNELVRKAIESGKIPEKGWSKLAEAQIANVYGKYIDDVAYRITRRLTGREWKDEKWVKAPEPGVADFVTKVRVESLKNMIEEGLKVKPEEEKIEFELPSEKIRKLDSYFEEEFKKFGKIKEKEG